MNIEEQRKRMLEIQQALNPKPVPTPAADALSKFFNPELSPREFRGRLLEPDVDNNALVEKIKAGARGLDSIGNSVVDGIAAPFKAIGEGVGSVAELATSTPREIGQRKDKEAAASFGTQAQLYHKTVADSWIKAKSSGVLPPRLTPEAASILQQQGYDAQAESAPQQAVQSSGNFNPALGNSRPSRGGGSSGKSLTVTNQENPIYEQLRGLFAQTKPGEAPEDLTQGDRGSLILDAMSRGLLGGKDTDTFGQSLLRIGLGASTGTRQADDIDARGKQTAGDARNQYVKDAIALEQDILKNKREDNKENAVKVHSTAGGTLVQTTTKDANGNLVTQLKPFNLRPFVRASQSGRVSQALGGKKQRPKNYSYLARTFKANPDEPYGRELSLLGELQNVGFLESFIGNIPNREDIDAEIDADVQRTAPNAGSKDKHTIAVQQKLARYSQVLASSPELYNKGLSVLTNRYTGN